MRTGPWLCALAAALALSACGKSQDSVGASPPPPADAPAAAPGNSAPLNAEAPPPADNATSNAVSTD